MKKKYNFFVLLILIFITLNISACGSNKKSEITPEPIKRNSLLRELFPSFNRYKISEKDEFIKLKASNTVYIMKGGTGEEWLKRNKLTNENWEKLEKKYWLDPDVRTKVSKLTYRILNKLEK